MSKYCLRKKGAYPSPYGKPGDLIWELDEKNNYIRALVAWPMRFPYGSYKLHRKDDDGHWRRVGEITDRLLNVRISEVRGLTPEQIKAIQKDLAEGVIEQRLYKRDT